MVEHNSDIHPGGGRQTQTSHPPRRGDPPEAGGQREGRWVFGADALSGWMRRGVGVSRGRRSPSAEELRLPARRTSRRTRTGAPAPRDESFSGSETIRRLGANGPACTPGSVRGPFDKLRAPWTVISLGDTLPCRSSGLPGDSASRVVIPCLALLRTRFTWRVVSPRPPVVSYTTLSPLPRRPLRQARGPMRRSALCGTVSRIAPGGCYPPSCPVEPGRSSARANP